MQTAGGGGSTGRSGMLVVISGTAQADRPVTCVQKKNDGVPQPCIYFDAVTTQEVLKQIRKPGEWVRDAIVVEHNTDEAAVWRLEAWAYNRPHLSST
jgi:hypothetical protein